MDASIPATTQTPPRKATTSVATPATSSAVVVHIDEPTLQATNPMQILRDVIQAHSVPEAEQFELLCRIRTSVALRKGNHRDREKLVLIRLLAVAIFGHTHTENQASTSLFLYEPDLITHVAELLQVDKGISDEVQTVAISALDAMARYRSRIQEVLTSVNAGVNHGILMSLIRKTVNQIALEDSQIPHSFVEALLSFVTFIASHASGGNMVVGAGLIPLLIQVLDNKHPQRLPVISKAMQLVDNILYSFTNAFTLFCTSHGVESLVERIAVRRSDCSI
jgi:E3 ubiquitin-protein ligase HUWE1